MDNKQEIAAYYALLEDDLLLAVYQSDFTSLTPEAREIVSREISKRNLIVKTENEEVVQTNEINSEYIDWLTEHLLHPEKKAIVHADANIDQGNPPIIREALLQIKSTSAAKLQLNESTILWAAVWFMGGLAFSLLPLPRTASPLLPVLAYGSIGVGCIRFIHGMLLRNRHQKLVKETDKALKEPDMSFNDPAIKTGGNTFQSGE